MNLEHRNKALLTIAERESTLKQLSGKEVLPYCTDESNFDYLSTCRFHEPITIIPKKDALSCYADICCFGDGPKSVKLGNLKQAKENILALQESSDEALGDNEMAELIDHLNERFGFHEFLVKMRAVVDILPLSYASIGNSSFVHLITEKRCVLGNVIEKASSLTKQQAFFRQLGHTIRILLAADEMNYPNSFDGIMRVLGSHLAQSLNEIAAIGELFVDLFMASAVHRTKWATDYSDSACDPQTQKVMIKYFQSIMSGHQLDDCDFPF